MGICIFCDREKIEEGIVHETEDFFVKVGFGLVTAGHVFIFPKEHYDCLAEMPKELWDKFMVLKEEVKRKVKENFSEPFMVEYGNCGTVAHAHAHLIPLKGEGYEVKSIMEEMGSEGEVEWEEINWNRLREIYLGEKKYVWIEEKGKSYVGHVSRLGNGGKENNPGFLYRVFFTEVKGLKAVHNWKKLIGEEKKIDEKKRKKTKKILGVTLLKKN